MTPEERRQLTSLRDGADGTALLCRFFGWFRILRHGYWSCCEKHSLQQVAIINTLTYFLNHWTHDCVTLVELVQQQNEDVQL